MRTYPLRSAFNATGIPWGPRSTNTGTPLAHGGTPALQVGSPYVLSLSTSSHIAIWCQLISGTSCVVVPWFYDSGAGLWVAQSPVTVNADKVITLDTPAIPALYVEQKTFVGGAVVEVTCRGNGTQPGQN